MKIKVKKVCKCGRIFYDTGDNKKCPTCVMKRNVKISGITLGTLTLGTFARKHIIEIKSVAKKVGDIIIKIAKK